MAEFNNMQIKINSEIFDVVDVNQSEISYIDADKTKVCLLKDAEIIDFEQHFQEAYDKYLEKPNDKQDWLILRVYKKIHNLNFVPNFNF